MTSAVTSGTAVMEKASAGMREIISAFTVSETRYFDEERYSEAELKKSLLDGQTDRKIDAMKRILAHVSTGRDASSLFPDVVKNVSFPSLELKKLIYIYLVQYAENNRDLALLSINSFQKDLSDRSQLVRAGALRAMASIKVLEVIQLVMVAVKQASVDSSPYVRKTAAQCMTKVYAVDPDQFFELRALLLKLMSDAEVQVVGSAVMAFHYMCVVQVPRIAEEAEATGEGGGVDSERGASSQLALLHPHFKRLCQHILLMDSWAQQCCIDLLLRYSRIFFASPDAVQDAKAADAAADAEDKGEATAPEALAVSEDFVALMRSFKLLLNSNSQGVTLAAASALCYLAPAQDLGVVTRPLLRCLQQAPPESAQGLLMALTPIIEARPELIRPSIRDFFVQSFDFPAMKDMKLKVLEKLVDETNVQLVLRELQAYVSWHSQPEFVAQAVQSISHVALKISSVADHCLRGLVKMLDSKCEALSCEAVVALRALLQQRQQSSDSGLGSVLPHLVHYLEGLAAPTARASVVWIVGQYQQEVPKLAPDVVRKLAKTFVNERQEVKQQILGLSLKVWAFHILNSEGQIAAKTSGDADKKQPSVSVEESKNLLPRLEALVDYILKVASFDVAWDIRDMARALSKLKSVAKESLAEGADSTGPGAFALSYCRACVEGTAIREGDSPSSPVANEEGSSASLESTWMLGSLAQALDFPLDSYRPLPGWAKENSSDELRKPKVEQQRADARAAEAKSISSSNVGVVQHMEQRVQHPSNISNLPQVATLEDLDLFYSEDTSTTGKLAAHVPPPAAASPQPTLEQMSFNPATPVGTAVFGEDDESDEEDSEDGDDDSWKYCQDAPAAAPAAPAAAPANAPSPVDAPGPVSASAAPTPAAVLEPEAETPEPALAPAAAPAGEGEFAEFAPPPRVAEEASPAPASDLDSLLVAPPPMPAAAPADNLLLGTPAPAAAPAGDLDSLLGAPVPALAGDLDLLGGAPVPAPAPAPVGDLDLLLGAPAAAEPVAPAPAAAGDADDEF